MEKKSIWGAIFLNSALAVALAVYTIVAIVTGMAKPSTKDIVLALRINDEYEFAAGKITFEGLENEIEKVSDKSTKYVAKNVGDFTCQVVKKDKSKVNYKVTVYDYGTGTAEDPYNIAKADHLFDLDATKTEGDTIYDQLDKVYAIRADIDLGGKNWKPIGHRTGEYLDQIEKNGENYSALSNSYEARVEHMFTGTILGNGHVIKNLTINVTPANFHEYVVPVYGVKDNKVVVTNALLELGFIGYANKNADKTSAVKDLGFEGAKITVDPSLANKDWEYDFKAKDKDGTEVTYKGLVFTYSSEPETLPANKVPLTVNVGVVAGRLTDYNIENVSVNNSAVTAIGGITDDANGLLAGVAVYSNIKNAKVTNSTIKANSTVAITGGLVGEVYHALQNENSFENLNSINSTATVIDGVTMENVNVIGVSNRNSYTGGVVGEVYGAKITNVNAKGLNVTLNSDIKHNAVSVVGGAVGILQNVVTIGGEEYNAELTNATIAGEINVKEMNGHFAAGLVNINAEAKIENSVFNGTIIATRGAGLVAYNYGDVVFTQAKEMSVSLTVAVGGAGAVYANYGNVKGLETVVNTTINRATGMTYFDTDSIILVELARRAGLLVNYTGAGYTFGTKEIDGVKHVTINYKDPNNQDAASVEEATLSESAVLNQYLTAGLVALSYTGEISGFTVNATLSDGINQAGAVARADGGQTDLGVFMFKKNEDNTYDFTKRYYEITFAQSAEIKNIVVNANIKTNDSRADNSTKRVAGALAIVGSNVTISDVKVSGDINKGAAASQSLTGHLVAGLVAEMNGNNIKLDKSETSLNMVANTSTVGYKNNSVENGFSYIVYVAGAVAYIEQTEGEANVVSNVTVNSNTILNNLGSPENKVYTNGYNGRYFADIETSGAYGLIAVINGRSAAPVKVENCKVNANVIRAFTNASSAFGKIYNVSISGVETVVNSSLSGTNVAGFVATSTDVTIEKSGANINTLSLEAKLGDNQNMAGFVAGVYGNLTVTDCYAIVGNELKAAANNSEPLTVSAFAIQRTSSVACTVAYTNVVCRVKVSGGDVYFARQMEKSGTQVPTTTRTNVFVLSAPTATENGVVTDVNSFVLGEVWEIAQGAQYPTFKVVASAPVEGGEEEAA